MSAYDITMDLPVGTYYLTETQAKDGYQKLNNDIIFTIGTEGSFTVDSTGHSNWLHTVTDENGLTTYTLTIPNGKSKYFEFHKVWYPVGSSTEKQPWKQNITVTLYQEVDNKEDIAIARYVIGMNNDTLEANATSLITDEDAPAITVNDQDDNDYSFTIGGLPFGDTFYLVESDDIEMNLIKYGKMTNNKVEVDPSAQKATEDDNYIINRDTGGIELPESGGPGTTLIYLIGSILLLGCGTILVARRRVRRTS